MKNRIRNFAILLSLALAGTAFAVPPAVEKVASEMLEAGADARSAYTKDLGVFVVAAGEAEVTGSKAKAKTIARVNAQKKLAEFFGSQVEAAETASTESKTGADGQEETVEYFKSVIKTQVKQILKGVQDYKVVDDGDKVIAIVYLTTKGTDKTKELHDAMNKMGDEGTVAAVGEGKTHDIAVQLALRSAVEQVVGTMVVGTTKITDNAAVKSKIFSGAQGFVDTYRITSETTVSVGVRIEIVAKVSKKKILDSYRVYLKTLGDPIFYLECTSSDSDGEDKQIAARFGQFFRKLGFKISKTPEGANYCINAHGEYRRVKNPIDEEQTFTQYSMIIRVLSRSGEELLSIPNNPRKSAVCINNPEREREICAEKAFKQMEKPVHEAINEMIAKMMADHTDKLMNSEE